MPIKKKRSDKTSAIKSEASEDPKEEHRASVTQVVEVVDEKEALEAIKRDAEKIEESVNALEDEQGLTREADHDEQVSDEVVTQPTLSQPEDTFSTEEQKKEIVDELFTSTESTIMPEISMHTRKTTKTMVIWGAIVIGVAVLTGGVLLTILGKGGDKFRVSFGPSPTPTTAETPTPTPTPDISELKRRDVTIEVLNGGGIAGAGSKMKKFLEDKGYSVTRVGNTEEYTYDKTQILVKSAKASFLELLKADLKDSYTVDKAESTLPPEASADAQIIVGKE